MDLCHEEVKRKIAGPDKGRLTAEQREALEYAIDNVDPCPIVYIDAIRDLLSGAGVCRSKHAWEATGERIEAIESVLEGEFYPSCDDCLVIPSDDAVRVLRATLKEVK